MRLTKDKYTLEHFHFDYLIGERPEGAYDTISLSFKNEDKKYSITHMLYESGEIQERSFSLNCLNRTRNEMYFGGVPQEKRMKYQAELRVRELNEKWNVNMEYVIYSNKANVFYRNNFIFINIKREIIK